MQGIGQSHLSNDQSAELDLLDARYNSNASQHGGNIAASLYVSAKCSDKPSPPTKKSLKAIKLPTRIQVVSTNRGESRESSEPAMFP